MVQQQGERIKQLKNALNEAKDQRYRAEARLESLEQEEKKLLQELEELGVEPDQLEEEIKRLGEEIERRIQEAWSLLPEELNRKHGSRA